MSRGFVKEDDLEHAGTDLPEHQISTHPNYVTPVGLKQLEDEANALDKARADLVSQKDNGMANQKLAVADRDLRYLSARLEQAILVEAAEQDKSTVLFGSKVHVKDEYGELLQFHLVGEDEADIAQQKVSYFSPIAKALIGRKVGDSVIWKRPVGAIELEILKITY
jgi:transcription elongation factor GreB